MRAVARVGQRGWYILGEEVAAFERALGQAWGGLEVVGCASGLDALELALRAMGLAPGERVLTTPLSAFATTLAIHRAGGVPCFVDVDESGLVDLELAAQARRRPAFALVRPCTSTATARPAPSGRAPTPARPAHPRGLCAVGGRVVGGRPDRYRRTGAATRFYRRRTSAPWADGGALLTREPEIAGGPGFCAPTANRELPARPAGSTAGSTSCRRPLRDALLPRLEQFTRLSCDRGSLQRRAHGRHDHAVPAPPVGLDISTPFAAGTAPVPSEHLSAHGIDTAAIPQLIPAQRALEGTPFSGWDPPTRGAAGGVRASLRSTRCSTTTSRARAEACRRHA